MTELFISKEYKSTKAFINACRKAISQVTGEYPEDALTMKLSENEPDIEEILRTKEQYHYDSSTYNLSLNKYSHIYVHEVD